mgnify:CR=1 FL=1
MAARRGDTLLFPTPPIVAAHAAIGGKKEGEGPLAACFDALSADNFFGQSSWEAAEKELALQTARLCLKKAQTTPEKVSLVLAGDLQAQCTASSYAMRELGIPFAGLFGACSTMAEALGLGAALCSAGMADGLLAMTSSHFCAAERQFRTPLSYGAVRTPTAQWTATAAGACLLRPAGEGVQLCAVTFGRVQDYKIKDINNMGAAMAPAAAATLLRYLKDTGSAPEDFDRIYTGDLGHVGSQLLRDLLAAEGLLLKNHVDCGCILYDATEQTVKSGGSGPRAGDAEAGALYRHRRTDEPDDLFAEGEHPGHRPSCGAAQPAAEGGKRMNYFWAFVVGGGICVIGQMLIDLTGLTPARILTGYVVAGVILSAVGWYGPLAEFAGCGATVPLLGFGHLLAKGVRTAIEEEGAIGILTGGLTAAAAGITTSLICGVVCSWVGKSHDQN